MKKLLKSLIFSLLLLLLACETTSQVNETTFDESLPDEQSKGVFVNRYNGEKLEFSLKAKTITRYYESRKTIADSVFISSVDEETGILSTISCNTTTIDDTSNLVKGEGNVILKYGDTRTIKTELVLWDRANDKIRCPREVDFWDGDNYLHGNKLITNSKLEVTKLENVSGEGVADEKMLDDYYDRSVSKPSTK